MSSSAATAKRIKELLRDHRPGDERADAARLDELRRIFSRVAMPTIGDDKTEVSDTMLKWHSFLKESFQSFLKQLVQSIELGRKTAIRCMWGVISTRGVRTHCKDVKIVSAALLQDFIRAMMDMEGGYDRGLQHMVQSEFFHAYVDVQYYACVTIAQLAKDLNTSNGIHGNEKESKSERLYQLLLMVHRVAQQSELDSGKCLFPVPQRELDESVEDCTDHYDDDENANEDHDGESDFSDSDDDENNDNSKTQRQPLKRKRSDLSKETTKERQHRFPFQVLKSHRKAHTEAWLAIMALPLPRRSLVTALPTISEDILRIAPEPLRFSDLFMNAFTCGDDRSKNTVKNQSINSSHRLVSILALDGLFTLMIQHGLELPSFYTHLYGLVHSSVFHLKYRTRFLTLLAKALLHNPMLPSHVVASFQKRLLRSVLMAPPTACLYSLALCSNLLRKFPETACLIHRDAPSSSEHENDSRSNDVFDAETNDPSATRALESSLWELHVLERHYYFAIATMAKSVGREEDTGPMHNLQDFQLLTYKSLFDQERKRSVKKRKQSASTPTGSVDTPRKSMGNVPLTFVEPKEGLFASGDVLSSILLLPDK